MRNMKKIIAITLAISIAQTTFVAAVELVPPHPNTNSVAAGPGETRPVEAQTTVSTDQYMSNINNAALADVSALAIQSEGAIVINANTGEVLYAKNPDTKYYPASITKLLTALLVVEQTSMTDTVTFTEKATTNLESGSVSLGVSKGDQISVKDCLYGMLIKSANEVANGLAEHTAGSVEAFVAQMNARAAALGCTNTNFTNPHGLNNSNHYTTPRDMAKIAREVFKNNTVCEINNTTTYAFPATKKAGITNITIGHKMLQKNDARYYEGIIGGKTGYTSLAGNTLVTAVEKNGVRLIAVVMKSKSTHYADTKLLLDYGFSKTQPQSQMQSETWVKNAGGKWIYYQNNGTLLKNGWLFYKNSWYYLGGDGVMLTNTKTPDGYWVNDQGVWIS